MPDQRFCLTSLITPRFVARNNMPRLTAQLLPAGEVRSTPAPGQPPLLVIPPHALRQALRDGLFDRLPCALDHAASPPGLDLRCSLGRWRRPAYHAQKSGLEASLEPDINPRNLQLFAILSRAAFDEAFRPGMVISVSCSAAWQQRDGRKWLTRFHHIDAADLYFLPTPDGRILKLLTTISQLPALKQSLSPEEFNAFLDTLPAADPLYYAGLARYTGP